MEIPEHPPAIHDGNASELEHIGVLHHRALEARPSDPIQRERRLLEKGLESDAPPIAARQAKGQVGLLAGATQARVVRLQLTAEALGLSAGSLTNCDDPGTAFSNRRMLLLHLNEALAADGSSEMAKKDENRGTEAPELRQPHLAIVLTQKGNFGSRLSQLQLGQECLCGHGENSDRDASARPTFRNARMGSSRPLFCFAFVEDDSADCEQSRRQIHAGKVEPPMV